PGDEPLAVQEDSHGALWVGMYARGLTRFENGRFTTLTTKQGLPDDTVLRILVDARGEFWMSCPRGIYRVAEGDLREVASGRATTLTVIRYGRSDGLPTADCGGGTQPAGWRARDGKLWFPTSKGLAVVDPEAVPVNRVPPPVRIERVVHDRADLAPG